ncbi:PREDICTED: artemin isoform X1 [Hipposideros armiger]|uniref:Artemin n=1 Tax=Hipposideros armiger TaxID=186990 RepID=A0A8B7REP4_HIPAR|nr:PREDICTED: artemin isoform X1 [Hipposideros armiger]XP_019499250.1 PREDICTED: artemin isoform X1 [Hipposideros armiger]XP_019499252.1 PREDICTED: artemin isoform X1 [Hipposideros armiger]
MEPGCRGPSVLPCRPPPRRQPALWPTLAALALLSSISEASLGPALRSPATREGPAPAPAPRAGHLPESRAARWCGGRARRPPPQPAPPPPAPAPSPSRGNRAARARGRGGRARAPGSRDPGPKDCSLRSQVVPVRLLGLGHSSDEMVTFGFCTGSCRRARSPHDLSLARLLGAGALREIQGVRLVSQPCCRPTHYEAVTFMDVNSTWWTVDRLSATACGCLG